MKLENIQAHHKNVKWRSYCVEWSHGCPL